MTRIATRVIAAGLFGCLVGLVASTSCNRRVEQACYEELEYIEPDPGTLAPDLPFCKWTIGTTPDPPEGYAFTHRVSVSFIPTDEDPCDPCDIERLDQMLRTAIEERMSQGSPSCARIDPSEPVGVCVHPPSETSDQCAVLGIFYSNHRDVPVEHGCTDCRESGTCP